MEQQKVLWIIFSVALFVLVVVSISVVWFLPDESGIAGKSASRTAGAATPEDREYNPVQWVRGREDVPESSEAVSEDQADGEDGIFIVYGESSEQTSGDGSMESGTEGEEQEAGASVVQESESKESRSTAQPTATSSDQKQITVVQSPSTSSKPAVSTRAVTPTPPSKPKTVRITEYWIQAGSYQSKQRAESARETLEEKGVTSRITTKDVGSDTFYRVRIGPYPNKAEAAKFLDWIRDVSTFEGSYISQVYVQRTAN